MSMIPRGVFTVMGAVVGLPTGALIAFLLTWGVCVLLDPVYNGLRSAGWVYCFLTVPIGAVAGAVVGGVVAGAVATRLTRT